MRVEAELRAGRFPESRLDDPAYGEPGDQPGLVVSRVLDVIGLCPER